jgi:5-amino-6-(5-phosphoribosylamino)uracil reductase/diaminohydroxyphosphoribosylaminopyrimidine deaminase/5-amino-6-(5-phosphoribosylamino)uracil reductase
MTSFRPRVTLHFAQSLDGKIALRRGRALLSSPEGVELAHRARAAHDAVLVGSATVRVDDPQLTVRACPGRHPRRVVVASTLDLPSSARVLAQGASVIVVGTVERSGAEARARLEREGAQVCLVPMQADGLVSLGHALELLRSLGVQRLLVEGGARILTSFLRERLADEATIEIAPTFLGDPALTAIGTIGAAAAIRLEGTQLDRAGANIVVRGRIAY